MTTARDLQERLHGRLTRPSQEGATRGSGRWLRVSVDLPPDLHEQVTRFAFEHGRVKIMHLGQALYELLVGDEDLQKRVLAALPTLPRKS